MARVNHCGIRQHHELCLDTMHQLIMACVGNIGAANTTPEEHIAAKKHTSSRLKKGNMAGCMAGRK